MPLSEVERLLEHSLAVLYCLAEKPKTLPRLNAIPGLPGVSQSALKAVLTFLVRAGYLETQVRGAHSTPVYSVRNAVLRLIPEEPEERFRLGHLDMLDSLARYFDSEFTRPNPGAVGQRSFIAQLRPDDLNAFIPAHAKWVRERLLELE